MTLSSLCAGMTTENFGGASGGASGRRSREYASAPSKMKALPSDRGKSTKKKTHMMAKTPAGPSERTHASNPAQASTNPSYPIRKIEGVDMALASRIPLKIVRLLGDDKSIESLLVPVELPYQAAAFSQPLGILVKIPDVLEAGKGSGDGMVGLTEGLGLWLVIATMLVASAATVAMAGRWRAFEVVAFLRWRTFLLSIYFALAAYYAFFAAEFFDHVLPWELAEGVLNLTVVSLMLVSQGTLLYVLARRPGGGG